VDSADQRWISNALASNLSELTAASGYSTGVSHMPFFQAQKQFAFALDASGNVRVADNLGDNVSEYIGMANPVLTPVQACRAGAQDARAR
jgi:hypothetical protein